MKPLVYVAGPYTNPDPIENVHNMCKIATMIREDGFVTPILPHITAMWHLVDPRPYETWINYDLEVMDRCDAVLRIAGASSGADGEVLAAHDSRIPVFYDTDTLYDWAKSVRLEPPWRYHYGSPGLAAHARKQ